jgi:hypothetical protein
MITKDRLLNSLHDFIFAAGVGSLLLVGAWAGGYVGCVFSWTGSKQINAINMAYTGDIDENGKYTKRK